MENAIKTMVEKMMITDYHLNYHGKVMAISSFKSEKIYYLFRSGSGYTYSDGYEGTEYGELYQSNGTELILVGNCRSYIGQTSYSKITLKGVEFSSPLSAESIFTKISKN